MGRQTRPAESSRFIGVMQRGRAAASGRRVGATVQLKGRGLVNIPLLLPTKILLGKLGMNIFIRKTIILISK